MRKFINIKTINDKNVKDMCINQYLKYMSVLSRQLLSTIKHDFDPYLLSNDIDHGIWEQPESLKKIMEFNIHADQK